MSEHVEVDDAGHARRVEAEIMRETIRLNDARREH